MIQEDCAISEEDLEKTVRDVSNDPEVDGIIVQMPLPEHIDSNKIVDQLDPMKDVDGLTKINMGSLMLGSPHLLPCTPLAILTLIEEAKIDTKGKHLAIVGRSNIVGKPLFNLMVQEYLQAHVSVIEHMHSDPKDISEFTRLADVVIVAAGQPNLITPNHIKEGAVLIDVGINEVEDPTRKSGRRVVGDISRDCYEKCGAYTPVPGGVGVLTVAALMQNTLLAANKRYEMDMLTSLRC